jgi:hypothetical protein
MASPGRSGSPHTGFTSKKSQEAEQRCEGCLSMQRKPSEKCGDCICWYEDPFLCHGCPNNPDTEDSRKNDLDEVSGLSRKTVVPPDV